MCFIKKKLKEMFGFFIIIYVWLFEVLIKSIGFLYSVLVYNFLGMDEGFSLFL